MSQYAPNNKLYTENQTIPNQLEYPILGAAGAGTRRRDKTSFYRSGDGSLEELINATSVAGNPGIESGAGDVRTTSIDPDQKNEILGIPSFLSYPSDLGKNRRFHHFVVFNIYQGSSDTVRTNSRKANQITSSLLAKGGIQFNNQGGQGGASPENQTDIYNNLIKAGYSPSQANQFSKALFSGITGLEGIGLKSDENIGALDNLAQGAYSNPFGVDPETQQALDTASLMYAVPVGAAVNVAGGVVQGAKAFGDGVVNTYEFASSFFATTNRDKLEDANKNPKNFNQRGASGRLVNRPKEEQNILLANQRFNNANIKSKDTIALYMPQKFAINDQMVYSEEDMGTSKMLLDALSGKRGAVSALLEKTGRKGISDAVGLIGQMAQNSNQIIGGAVNEIAAEANLAAVRAAATRTVQNPRKEMMFRDVNIRTHAFSFDFMPRNEQEAETVLNIIRMFRYHAHPGLQGGGGHFYTFPAEFEMTFYTIQEPSGMVVVNDNLPKMPRLALQSVSVDFSAAGDFKTFTDAKPAFIRLELGFQEMEQLTNEHIVHGY
jgi:hypothetical protein